MRLFDPQSLCLQDLSRPFRWYTRSPFEKRRFTLPLCERTYIAGRRRARCDVFKSLLLRYTDRVLPRGWSTTIRTLSIRVAISATTGPQKARDVELLLAALACYIRSFISLVRGSIQLRKYRLSHEDAVIFMLRKIDAFKLT